MSRELITGPTDHDADATEALRLRDLLRLPVLLPPLAAAIIGVLFAMLVYQIPAVHRVDIGGYDAGYVLGFHDPDRATVERSPEYLVGSDGSSRWTRSESYLLFPQAGLPAQVTLRLRGHPHAATTPLTILVNGLVVDRFALSPDWQERTLAVSGGLLKSDDVLITIQSETYALADDDPRRVGVLIDQVAYTTGPAPLLPYPSQLIYAAIASGLLWVLVAPLAGIRRRHAFALGLTLLMLAFLLFYRLQPIYPFPLRGLLPQICLGLAALLAVRHATELARLRSLANWAALLGGAIWLGLILSLAQNHLVLSVPGVEKDFRVFATRLSLDQIFHADGFYNLGYPLLLWLVRPLVEDSPFLAARMIAACSGAVLLLATWSIARRRLGAGSALVALALLALSPLVVQYALYLGSDMPFAAACGLSLALLDAAVDPQTPARARRVWLIVLAGLSAGLAFLVRHPGAALLLVGWVVLLISAWRAPRAAPSRLAAAGVIPIALFTGGFVLAILPQLVVNLRDTGQLFYSQQSKNIWLAVFGDGDWGRWGEASNNVTFAEVLLQDPLRFWANFSGNLRAFVGSGAEDTSEFGRAIQLRLLGFPANWLAIGGLLGWLWMAVERRSAAAHLPVTLLVWLALYVPAIAVGFALPRFFLPLTPVYALAAAWALARIAQRTGALRVQIGLAILCVWLVAGGLHTGATTVLRLAESGDALPGQPAATVAIARLALETLQPGETLLVRVPTDDEAGLALAKYSALSQRVGVAPVADDPTALRATGATLLIWSERLGPPPILGPAIGQAGPYTLYRIDRV